MDLTRLTWLSWTNWADVEGGWTRALDNGWMDGCAWMEDCDRCRPMMDGNWVATGGDWNGLACGRDGLDGRRKARFSGMTGLP